MTGQGVLQLVLYVVVLLLLVKPLGAFMAAVYEGRRTFLSPLLGPVERVIYRLAGVDEKKESDWKRYALQVLLVNLIGFLVVYLLQRLQGVLPLNPQDFAAVSADSSFNTAVSFATNTNWQGYVGETTMSYLTQMTGPCGTEFFIGGFRHGGADRSHSRLCEAAGKRDWEFLGRLHTQHTLYTVAAVADPGHRTRIARRRAELLAVPHGEPGRADDNWHAASRCIRAAGDASDAADGTNHPARSGGESDRHQTTGHQWRRLLQCQFCASVRESDAAVELPSKCWRSC